MSLSDFFFNANSLQRQRLAQMVRKEEERKFREKQKSKKYPKTKPKSVGGQKILDLAKKRFKSTKHTTDDAFERYIKKNISKLKISPVDNGESKDWAVYCQLKKTLKAYKRLKNKL